MSENDLKGDPKTAPFARGVYTDDEDEELERIASDAVGRMVGAAAREITRDVLRVVRGIGSRIRQRRADRKVREIHRELDNR